MLSPQNLLASRRLNDLAALNPVEIRLIGTAR
jgi:hypothetical protein